MAGNVTRSEANQSFFVYVRDTNTGIVKRVAIPGDVQVGLAGRPAELQLFGRLSVSSATVVVDASNKGIINVSNDDTVVAVQLVTTPLGGRIKANLPPSPRDGQLHFIKDMSGTAASVPIDVVPPSGVTIDGLATKTLSDAFGSLALVWLSGAWRMLVAGLGASGGGGAGVGASYVTINPEPGLTSERHLTGSTNVTMTDQGAKGHVYFDLSTILGGAAGTFSYPTLTVDAYGRITSINNGAAPPPSNASYVTVTTNAGLPGERILSGTFGIKFADSGPAGNIVASFDSTLLVAGAGISIATLGDQVRISSSGTGSDPWIDTGTGKVYTTSSVDVTGTLGVSQNLNVQGISRFYGSLSGSLQRLTDGVTSYIDVIGGLSVFTRSNGQVVISGSGGGSASTAYFAPSSAEYVLLALTSSLPQGRLLSQGTGIAVIDSGPQNLITVSINNNVVATVSGTTFTGPVIAQGVGPGKGFSGSLQLLSDGLTPYLVGAGGISVFTKSNGQVVVSSSISSGGSGTSTGPNAWVDLGNSIFTTSSTSIDTGGRPASSLGTDVFFYVSGTVSLTPGQAGRKASLFGGSVVVSGTLAASGGLSGSLQLLVDGRTPYLVGVGGTTVTTQSNGQVVISSSVGGSSTAGVNVENSGGPLPGSPYSTLDFSGSNVVAFDAGSGVARVVVRSPWYDLGTFIRTTASVAISGPPESGSPSTPGTDVFFYVSGTVGPFAAQRALFGGDMVTSGSLSAKRGLSGSLQLLADGRTPYMVGSNQAIVTTQSNGQVVVQVPIRWIDGGAVIGTTASVEIGTTNFGSRPSDVFFFVSGTTAFPGPSNSKSLFGGDVVVSGALAVNGQGGITGSLTQLPFNQGAFIVGIGGTSVSTGSHGQVIVSSSAGGSGGTAGINVENGGVGLPGSPYTVINFPGPSILASDVGGVATVTLSPSGTVTGSTQSRRLQVPLLAAMVTSPQFSASKANLGVAYFDPKVLNAGVGALRYFFRGNFGPVLGTGNAYIDLYDYNGIVNGFPAPVSGSVLTASSIQLNHAQAELTSIFSTVTGSGILLARAWSDPSGSNYVNVGGVSFDLEWQ